MADRWHAYLFFNLYIYVFAGLRAIFGGTNRRFVKKNGIKSGLFKPLLQNYSEHRDISRSRLT
jgi:hypothetical protein